MTARQLLAALAPFAPSFDGATGRYTLKPDAPSELVARFRVLKTGAAAILTGRAWLGLLPDGRAVELSPDALVPAEVTYLSLLPCGGTKWDRVPANARTRLPELFAPAAAVKPRTPPRNLAHADPADVAEMFAT